MNNLSEKKILSIGVYANEKKAASPNKEKIAAKACRDAYRVQLEQDMALKRDKAEREKEVDTLHPFDRVGGPSKLRELHNEHMEEDIGGGYQIGKDASSEENVRRRRDVQRRYLEQLERDAALSKEIRGNEEASPSKKAIKRRPLSPEVKGEFFIGAASSAGGEEKLEQAKLFYELNQEEINRKQMEKTQRSREVDIDGQFSIGADEDKKKRDKQTATKAYLEALNKDVGDRGHTRKEKQQEEYVNKTGWSGLHIGGAAAGNNAATTQHAQKDKQEAYKRLLDNQMSAAAERQMAEKMKEDEELCNAAMPPYLENRRW